MNLPEKDFSPSQTDFTEIDSRTEIAELKARVAELERMLQEKTEAYSAVSRNANKVWQRESDEKIRFALEAAGIGTWEWNIPKNEVQWSRNTITVLGLSPTTFKGTYEGFIEVIHPLDQPLVRQAVQRAIDELSNFEVEFRVMRPDGSIRWYAGKGKVISQETGQAARLLGVNYDIHDLKHATESLGFLVDASHTLTASLDYHTTLQQLAALAVPKLADWCMVFVQESPDEVKQLSVTHSDPARVAWALDFQKDYPYDKETGRRLQKDILQIIRTGLPQFLPEMSDEMLKGIAIDETHLRFMREMGPRSKIAVPLIARNRTLGVISFISSFESGRNYGLADLELAQELARQAGQAIDNSWLYRQAQEAIQAQRELDHLKDQFLSIASHELRTPLTTIKGYSQILQRDLNRREANQPNGSAASLREVRILNNVVNQVGRMENLVSEMLDVSRIQSGQFELKRSPDLDLNEVVRCVVEQQQDAANDHPLLFQPASVRLTGNWDEGRLEQVLNNLINNALKYSPAGEPVVVGLYPAENAAEVVTWVRDQGIGISPEHQAHIFDRFYRARTPMNVNVDGLGLGLFICHETISQHGGRMWLESVLGQGSTFYFSLPLSTAEMGGTEVGS